MRIFQKITASIIAVILPLLLVSMPTRSVYAQDPDDFTVTSFSGDYYLDKNSENRSTLTVVETITAIFPQTDQNHGIERAVPAEYDGHTVDLTVQSVQDAQKIPQPFTTYESNNNIVLRIGSPSEYVHGSQTYVITYVLQDVTKNFDNHDEFFWDINGTQWAQPFGKVTARVHLSKALSKAYDGRVRCYAGSEGSTAQNCKVTPSTEEDWLMMQFTAQKLGPYQGMSVVVGFKPQTFVGYQKTFWEKTQAILFKVWLIINILVPIAGTVWLLSYWRRFGKTPVGKGTIIPEYIPPKDISVLTGSRIIKRLPFGITAQIMDLCVRHYVKLYQKEAKKLFGTKRTYELELARQPHGLFSEELEVIEMIFGAKPKIGSKVPLGSLQNKLHRKAAALQKKVRNDAVTNGYYEDRAVQRKKLYWSGGILLFLSVCLLSPGIFLLGIAVMIVASNMWQLTDKGVVTRDYLLGLKEYMQMAEADRIKALQSPAGVSEAVIDVSDNKQLVKLYERLLPYAIIFGIESDWIKQFADLYTEPPEWYGGNWTAFNAAVLATSINDFKGVSMTTFSSPTDSTSSGFSSGGSVGGGGGGGGGGGW